MGTCFARLLAFALGQTGGVRAHPANAIRRAKEWERAKRAKERSRVEWVKSA